MSTAPANMPGVPVLPWHTEHALSWSPRAGGLVLCANDHDAAHCLTHAGAPAPGDVITVPPPSAGFENLCGFDAVMDILCDRVRIHCPEVLESHSRVLELFLSSRRAEQIGRLVPISEAAALGTTRRVSRESHTAALWIDEAARFVVAAVRAIATNGGAPACAALDISGIDLWDRPSLRILHRAVVLGDDDPALWARGTVRPPATGQAAGTAEPRTQFLAALAARPTVVVCGSRLSREDALSADRASGRATPPAVANSVREALKAGPDTLLKLIGSALALQNFERAHLLINGARTVTDDMELAAQLMRLSAICHAQAWHIDEALDELVRAIAISRRPEVIGHLYYLRGLIATKRHYDLDTAAKHYLAAMDVLNQASPDSAECLVEKAWLHNGLGLAAAMRAREVAAGPERDRCYAEAFDHEFSAFRLIHRLPGMSAFYLRYNLGYNLSFLLEITGRYQEARDFLTSVSSVLLAAKRADFGALYKYAIGIMELKSGDTDAATRTLGEAAELAHALRDPFYLERMTAAAGYAAHQANDHATAFAQYLEGAHIARWLRDEAAFRQQLSGVLWSAALGGLQLNAELLAAADAWFPDAVKAFRAGDALAGMTVLEAVGAAIPVPSSKLPSFIPIIDLEGTPQRDLNRFLAGVATAETPTVPARSPATAQLSDGGTQS